MSELLPLLESNADDFERDLLLAARGERPSISGLRDAALGLGLGAAAAATLAQSLAEAELLRSSVSPAASPLAANSVASPGAVAPQALSHVASLSSAGFGSSASLAVIAKFVGAFALASLIGVVSVRVVQSAWPSSARSTSRPLPALTSATHASAPASAVTPDSAAPAERAAPPVEEDAPPAKGTSVLAKRPASAMKRAASASRSSAIAERRGSDRASGAKLALAEPAPPSSVVPSSSLAAEVLLLDRARGALAASDAQRARALLDEYAASKPSGVLAQEAALLRVRSLLALGDRAGAAQLARRIIRENPGSRHVALLADLVSE